MVSIQVIARPGIYWDAHNFERDCVIVYAAGQVLTALDRRTGERILDPPSAIPISTNATD